jgi:hypothetical protein
MGALDQLPERAGWRGWKLEVSRDSSSGGTLQASSTMAQTRRGQRCRDIARFRRAGFFALPMRELAAIYHLPSVMQAKPAPPIVACDTLMGKRRCIA